jgi:hypothetical protein
VTHPDPPSWVVLVCIQLDTLEQALRTKRH